jgi:FkbM family methyltransferase
VSHDWRAFVRKGVYLGEERDAARIEFKEVITSNFIPHEVEPISRFVQASDGIVALDLGCNKGLWSKAVLDFYGSKAGHVYLVDASSHNVEECRNTEDNLVFSCVDLQKITVSELAIGDRDGEVNFYSNVEGSPVGSVFQHTVSGEHPLEGIDIPRLDASVVTVPLHKIDTYVAIHNIRRIDILKLDIEGNEWNALQGAKRVLSRFHIDAIQFEFGAGQVEARTFFRDFYTFFKNIGYNVYKISGEHFAAHGDYLQLIDRYSFNLERFDGAWNFVASPHVPRPLSAPCLLRSGSCGADEATALVPDPERTKTS